MPVTVTECAPDAGHHIPVCVRGRGPPAARAEPASPSEGATAPTAVRCLTRPARLTERQTRRLAAGAETGAADGAARPPTRRGQLKIGHLNVCSLIPKLNDVMMLLQDQQLDILCLTETWLTPDVMPEFLTFPGYSVVRRDRAQRRPGGGVAIIYRSEITVKALTMPASGPLETLWAVAT